ncbi:Capsular polysaccharide biosynthesis protein [Streptomyces sp. 2231.1]|uniref:hypothetical protein n=1 Tax=Streptomyces sp. 2231.1 TaxID=1855347 RepID=UPI00089A05CD|nr:hypothetical protein [Streptomyces sp. 2231.1]SEC02075.1 Capsular polysaccharide biosynthesis protein [Streptomyces sp. 2231.1]
MTGPHHFDGPYDEPDQMRDQLRRLLRHRAVIASGVMVGLLGGAGLALSRAHTYTSTSEVLVRSTADPFDTVSVAADNQVSMGTEQQIAGSAAVAVRAARALGQPASRAGALEQHLRITNPPKSQVLRFEFTAASPQHAARGANALADAYLADRKSRNEAAVQRTARRVKEQISAVTRQAAKEKENDEGVTDATTRSTLDALHKRAFEITSRDTTGGDVVRGGSVPTAPSGPGWATLLALGLLCGLGLGLLLAWLRAALDDRVRSVEDVRAVLQAPVLGLLPPAPMDDALLTVGHTSGQRSESYRALAYRLRGTRFPAGAGRFLVVAPRRGAAAAEVAVNLAAALAECGDDVLVVDADPDTRGLAAGLPLLKDGNRTPAESSVRQGSLRIDAGTAGSFAWCSSGGAGEHGRGGVSAAVQRVLPEAGSCTAVVVTRPMLEHADALAVAQRIDGVLLVTRLDVTLREDLKRVRELIGCSGATFLGAVADSGRRRRRLEAVLRPFGRRPAAEPAVLPVELPAQDDSLAASRG